MQNLMKIHNDDNVVVALTALQKDERYSIDDREIVCKSDIPAGHKMAIEEIHCGEAVVKYGHPIGHATADIGIGDWVHTHNIKTNLSDVMNYEYHPVNRKTQVEECQKFLGYVRSNGKVGIRNELWIIPTVGCVNSIVTAMAAKAQELKQGTIDAVVAFTHPYGCSQLGEDQEHTRKILADLIQHPNAGGVLVVGLGCENSGVERIKEQMGEYDCDRIKFMICQEHEDEMAEGLRLLHLLAGQASKDQREEVETNRLIVGLKCGGSDGFSGITANPLVGRFSNKLVAQGGTTILTEVPEMFGAETILMNRCKDQATFEKTVHLINDFKEYYIKNGQTIYENPSPGNKAGGISTLEDKSLGCTQKSGDSLVSGVYAYGEEVSEQGLNLLSAPGNDLVAATALAASGAQLILFTTGRGTPFASPVPTIKISSNSNLAKKKSKWIDFNAGQVLELGSFDQTSKDLFDFVLKTASGKLTKGEESGFHDMAIMKQGVTL